MANLVLSSFQRRMGSKVGVQPGDEMLAAMNFALYRRSNYAKGTTIQMKSGNCDQAYCPMREGCHSKTSSLDCGGFKCTSYIPGAGGGTNTGASNAERIARYEAYYDELKDMLLVDIYSPKSIIDI